MMHAHLEAIEDYTYLIDNGAASAEALLGRARCFEESGRLEHACTDAQCALNIDNENAYAHDLLARVYGKLTEMYKRKAEHHRLQAQRIRNPEGNLGPLFDCEG